MKKQYITPQLKCHSLRPSSILNGSPETTSEQLSKRSLDFGDIDFDDEEDDLSNTLK